MSRAHASRRHGEVTTRWQAGLTLVEMMITLSILAIIVSLAGPPYRTFVQNQRLSLAASELQRALALARTEALTRAMRVTVCSSTTGAGCDGTTDWSKGWMVYVDPGRDGFTANDTTLLVQSGFTGISFAKGKGGLRDSTSISYTGTGYTLSSVTGTIVFCDINGERARAVAITTAASGARAEAASYATDCT